MALEVGSRLGHFDVTALIGEGAWDRSTRRRTKLNRQVALKILPEAFASDPDRLARFQREAQVLTQALPPRLGSPRGLAHLECQERAGLVASHHSRLARRFSY